MASLLPAGDVTVEGTLREVTMLLGAASGIGIAPRLSLRGFLDAGVAYGSLNTGSAVPYAALQAGVGLAMQLTESLSARLDTAAVYKFGLAGGLGAGLGINYRLRRPPRRRDLPSGSWSSLPRISRIFFRAFVPSTKTGPSVRSPLPIPAENPWPA